VQRWDSKYGMLAHARADPIVRLDEPVPRDLFDAADADERRWLDVERTRGVGCAPRDAAGDPDRRADKRGAVQSPARTAAP
jgi:hypothetical protein